RNIGASGAPCLPESVFWGVQLRRFLGFPGPRMSGIRKIRFWRARTAKAAALLAVLSALTGCTGNDRVAAHPEPQASAPPPPAPAPPPVDLAGRWRLTAAS